MDFPKDFFAGMGQNRTTLHLLNTTILPASSPDGVWYKWSIDEMSALRTFLTALESSQNFGGPLVQSHIGHQATAEYASAIFRSKVEMDRSPWNGSGIALCCQLNGRPPEGKTLSLDEMREYGISWKILIHESTLENLLDFPQRMKLAE